MREGSCHLSFVPDVRPSYGLRSRLLAAEGLLEESARVARSREREMILSALRETGGNRRKAAEMLKVSYRTLLSRIKELGL